MSITLHVCTTCRAGLPFGDDDDPVVGAQLLDALMREAPQDVRVVGVACLSACSNGASVALSGPGRWSYVYGRLTPDDAPEILAGASAYAATDDGLVPWRERPTVFRKNSLARIPPTLPPHPQED